MGMLPTTPFGDFVILSCIVYLLVRSWIFLQWLRENRYYKLDLEDPRYMPMMRNLDRVATGLMLLLLCDLWLAASSAIVVPIFFLILLFIQYFVNRDRRWNWRDRQREERRKSSR